MPRSLNPHYATPNLLEPDGYGVMFAYGNTPPSGAKGYAKGCLFLDLDGAANYELLVNVGTVASCTFTAPYATSAQGAKAATAYSWGDHAIAGYLTSLNSYGPELIGNGSFETWTSSDPASWTLENTADYTYLQKETTIVRSGVNSAKLTAMASASWYMPLLSQNISVAAGSTYELQFWTCGDGTHGARYGLYDLSNAVYLNGSGGIGITTGAVSNTWTKITTTFVAPSGCTQVRLMLGVERSGYCYYDLVSIKKISQLSATTIAFVEPSSLLSSTNVAAALTELCGMSSVGFRPRVLLPTEIAAVVDDPLQIFTRGIVEAADPYALPVSKVSSVGTSYPRFWEYTPAVADVGTKTLAVTVTDLAKTTLTTATTNIVVVNSTGAPAANKNVLIIGDSLSGGTWQAEFLRRLTGTGGTPVGKEFNNITLIGDVPVPGYAGHGFVAFGGWTYGYHMGTASTTSGYVLTAAGHDKTSEDMKSMWAYGTSTYMVVETSGQLKVMLYTGTDVLPASGTLTHVSGATHDSDIVYTARTVEPGGSCFWDAGLGRASFTNWFTRIGATGVIDAAYILLGWNEIGTGPLAADHAADRAAAVAMIDRLHLDYPNALVRLIGLQVPSAAGLGANLGASATYAFYNCLRNANGRNLAMKALAAEPAYSSFVRYLDLASQFDSEWNMPSAAAAVNARNATTELRGTNGVHPDTSGYYQIADVAFRDFIRTFCSS